jgi:Tfp pilus assembly protein PilE
MYRHDTISPLGFTLIEALMVVGVIATTALFVYPTWMSYERETARGDAYAALLDLATREEHYYNSYRVYTDVIVAPAECSGASCGLAASEHSTDGYYRLSVGAGPTHDLATSFVLTATVQSGGRQEGDERCAVLTIDSRGATAPIECW